MISFTREFEDFSMAVLLAAVNVAVATTVIAALALIVSRFRFLSLPVQHAICVCGVAGAIMAPLPVVLLERWAPRFAESKVSDWPASKRSSNELMAARHRRKQDATSPHSSPDEYSATEFQRSRVAVLPDLLKDSNTAESEDSTTVASLNTAKSSGSIRDGRTSYGLMSGWIVVAAWLIGSVVYLWRRVAAEIRLRRWLATCNPIADAATMYAAQSAAYFAGSNDEAPLRRLAVQFRLRRWQRRRSRIAEAETLEAVQDAATAVELDERPSLLRSTTLPAPVVCGTLNPKLILPETMANRADGLSHDQLAAVLTHEMAHLARRDLVTELCLTIARIAYWWNPFVRILCRCAEDLGEQICDDFATASLQRPREYAAALLLFAERSTDSTPQAPSLGLSNSTARQLEFRV